MKKITAIFISVIIIVSCVFPIHVNAETDQYTLEPLRIYDSDSGEILEELPDELQWNHDYYDDPDESEETVEDLDSEEEWTVEYYEISEEDFDKLIEDSSSDNINETCNETNKQIYTPDDAYISVDGNWAFLNEHLQYFADRIFAYSYLKDFTNSEVYDYRFITIYMDSVYEIPFIIWLNTSEGIKFVAFAPAEENESKNFMDYYHADIYNADEFREKFAIRYGKVYYNGVELTSSKAIMRYKGALLKLKDIMEAAGVQVIDCDDGSIILRADARGVVQDQGIKLSFENFQYKYFNTPSISLTRLWDGADITEFFALMSRGTLCYYDADGELLVRPAQAIHLLRGFSYYGHYYNYEVKISPEDNEVYIKNMEDISIYLNGTELNFKKQTIREDERTLVSMREIFEALGATVEWNSYTSTATAKKDGTTISITIDSDVMYKNGEAIQLDVPARIRHDSYMFVPLRAVAEAFDCDVQWNEDLQRVDITY